MNKRYIYITLFLSILSINNFAQKRNVIPPEKPKLIIGIVVEQMKPEFLNRYWDKFSDNGFKRLFYQGSTFRNANFNYLLTQAGPGTATIFTGANPCTHGIIADNWLKRINNHNIYCITDNKYKTVGSDNISNNYSPKNILISTIGDELKLASPESKIISVSQKAQSAVLSSGHSADAAYWFDFSSGKWISSTYYTKELKKWVNDFNDKKFPDIYMEREWNTLLPIDKYTESLPDSNIFENGMKHQIIFPYNLNKLSGNDKKQKNYNLLAETPYGNTLTHDFAIAAILNEDLGKDNHTDFLSISFSANEYIGANFGTKSVELQDAYLRLDKELAHFLTVIDEQIGKENVLIFLTSNRGVSDSPEYLKSKKMPAGRFKHNYSITLLKSYLNALYGKGEWISAYMDKQVFLNHTLIEDSKIDLKEIQEKVTAFLIQYNSVANAVTSNSLNLTTYTTGTLEKMQNSYNPKRSGDIIINLMPGYIEDKSYLISSNSGYSYDTNVPLYFYGWKIKRQIYNEEISMEDIAPTLSLILNIPFPNGTTGKPITRLLDK